MNQMSDLQALVVAGETDWLKYGEVRTVRDGDLILFDYLQSAQYTNRWNWFESVSRGLILNAVTGEVVARPFDKFFNWGERTTNAQLIEATEKMDGCFVRETALNLWSGGTVTIGEIVNKQLKPTLIGMDCDGRLVPCEVVDWFNNGTKDNWLDIELDCLISRKTGSAGHANRMRVTGNHRIFLNGEFQSACFAKPGDSVQTFYAEPSDSVKHVIYAGMLGDGCVTKSQNGYRYQESHIQPEYINTINVWLGPCATKPRPTISGYGSTMLWATSKQYDWLASVRELFYPNGKRRIPDDLTWVDDYAIAKWYMDDGSMSHSDEQQDRATFHTNRYPKGDAQRLSLFLEERYGVRCTVFDSKGWTVRVNAGRDKSIDTFWKAIAPHVVPVMRYKLPERYRSIPYQAYPMGYELKTSVPAKVVSVKTIDIPDAKEDRQKMFPGGRTGYDIKTTTGNYFAKGILVHNSLGILYRADDEYRISTRGSFVSEQALWATHELRKYDLSALPENLTLLFEIIYPENRIVVNYKGYAGLVLIGIRDRFTGLDYHYPAMRAANEMFGFRTSDYHPFNTIAEALALAQEIDANQEGWVLRFDDGSRFKVKGDQYKIAHKLMTGISFNRVLEATASGGLDAMLEGVPDEFLVTIREYQQFIADTAANILDDVASWMGQAPRDSRKDFALWVKAHCPHMMPYMFAALDGHDLLPHIYKHAFKDVKFDRDTVASADS